MIDALALAFPSSLRTTMVENAAFGLLHRLAPDAARHVTEHHRHVQYGLTLGVSEAQTREVVKAVAERHYVLPTPFSWDEVRDEINRIAMGPPRKHGGFLRRPARRRMHKAYRRKTRNRNRNGRIA